MARIILVNRYFHPDESATSQMLTDLALHLGQRHDVVVLTSRQRLEDPKAQLPAADRLENVRVVRLWSSSLGRHNLAGRALDYATFLLAVALWLLFGVKRGDTLLAKTDPPLLGVITTLATLGRGVRRVQWLQDLYPETAEALGVVKPGPLTRLAVRLRDWSLRHSARVVTVSEGMKAYLEQRGHAGAALVHVPNWSEDHGVRYEGARDIFTVGYSGNLGRAHPIGGLVQLAELATDPRLQFRVSGGGAHYEFLRASVQRVGAKNWTFLPYQPRARLAELLGRPDLHLTILDPLAERYIFPSKVYGILAAGRPLLHLGDPEGEVARLLREHGCGWALPADSGALVLSLLQRLRESPEEVHRAGMAARAAYERCYARSGALRRWVEVLESV